MSKGRLTRQELSWLLTQEAQHAASRLRDGVKVLRTQSATPAGEPTHDPSLHVDASLDTLDDVMNMLSSLNQRAAHGVAVPGRRGRIDLAAVLVEIAPDAPVQIEPGSGTEIYADEADVRRMLQVLVGHGNGAAVTVRRREDDVRVGVTLGPDTSPTAETERAWLSRMALRYGGRHELEGGDEILVFPAEDPGDHREREVLQRELDAARRQIATYARELAAMFDRGEDLASSSTAPPPLGHEVASDIDLAEAVRLVADESASEAERAGVRLVVADPPAGARVRRRPQALHALLRGLVSYAISSTPRGKDVRLQAIGDAAPGFAVEDAGPTLAASARRALLALAPTESRPNGLPLYLAAELAAAQRGSLELADAVGGGLRIVIRFEG